MGSRTEGRRRRGAGNWTKPWGYSGTHAPGTPQPCPGDHHPLTLYARETAPCPPCYPTQAPGEDASLQGLRAQAARGQEGGQARSWDRAQGRHSSSAGCPGDEAGPGLEGPWWPAHVASPCPWVLTKLARQHRAGNRRCFIQSSPCRLREAKCCRDFTVQQGPLSGGQQPLAD